MTALSSHRTPMPLRLPLALALLVTLALGHAAAGPTVLDARLHHLRAGADREWADFPAEAEGPSLTVKFRARRRTPASRRSGCGSRT